MALVARTFAGLILSVGAAAVAVAAATQAPAVAPHKPEDQREVVVGCVIHEADYAATTAAPRVGAPALQAEFVIMADESGAYRVTGTREADLIAYLGRKVEVTGTIERPRVAATSAGDDADPVATGTSGSGAPLLPGGTRPGAAGVTPDGLPAHEPGDAVPGTAPVDPTLHDVPEPAEPAPPAVDVGELPRLNISSVRSVAGACESVPATTAAPSPSAPVSQERPSSPGSGSSASAAPSPDVAPAAPAGVPVTVIGCVMRSTPTGPVAGAPEGDLVLTRASVLGEERATAAAPGSPDGGTGTLPAPAPPAARIEDRAFVLVADASVDLAPLAGRTGQRAEVTGRLEGDAAATGSSGAPTSPDTAHPSAPQDRLRVTAFRPVGGVCF